MLDDLRPSLRAARSDFGRSESKASFDPHSEFASQLRLPHPSGFQHAPHRNRNAALSPPAGIARSFAHDFHDSARFLHDETERDRGNVSGLVAGVCQAASLRARRANRRLPRDVPATRRLARRDHRLRRRFAAAERRLAGRIRRACWRSANTTRRAAKRIATSVSFRLQPTAPIPPARSWPDSKSCRSRA